MRRSRAPGTESVNLDKVDLSDPGLYSDGDPHPVWHAMRERDPIRWQPVAHAGFWSVTRYADITTVLRDHSTFTSQRGTVLSLLGTADPASGRQLSATDPPRHTTMRSPVQHALSPRLVARYTEQVRSEVRTLLAPFRDRGTLDLAEVTSALPMVATGTLMGLDRADWPRLTRMAIASVAPEDPDYQHRDGPAVTFHWAHRELFSCLHDVVNHRQRTPGQDLVSVLLAAKDDDGRRLEPGEVVSNSYGLILGATVTTPFVANAALFELLSSGAYEDWLRHPNLLDSGVEEALRWASPTNHLMRHATRDVDLGGVPIREGDPVVVWLGSANRDEKAFAAPYRFDVRRRPNRHLAFGIGPHYCVGHTVARLSLRLFFEELLSTAVNLHIIGPATHLRSTFIVGIKHLPIGVTGRTQGAARRPPV